MYYLFEKYIKINKAMKKQIAIMISVLFCVSSVYADGVGSLFQKALKAGRDNNGRGCYTIQVPSSKNILVEDALQYMRKNGYILTKDYGTKQMIRFGYYAKAIRTVEFIPENELESYIANMPQTNQSGKAVIFPNSRKETVDVYWSGSINNGSINGNGVGYTKLNNCVYVIKGRFENGMPDGSCELVTATPVFANGRSPRFLQKIDKQNKNYTVGNANNGYRSLYMNGKYGFINDRGDIIVACNYGRIVQEFNDAGFAIVTDPSDGDQEIKINNNGTKLGYSDNQLRINEEKRLAKLEEERRIAEEKRQKELKEQEEKFYNELIFSINDNYQKFVDNINEYIRRFPEGKRINDVMAFKSSIEAEFAEVEKNKNSKTWSKGDKICYHDTTKGLVCGVLQSWNEKKTKAKLKIISGHIYNNQTTMTIGGEPVYKEKEIWIGTKEGWHLAAANELRQLSQWENLQGGVGGGGNYQPGNSFAGSNNPKLNSVGRQVYWESSVSFSVEGTSVAEKGLLIGLLNKYTGMDRASYTVRYTGVVEAVLGETSVKCIITNAEIIANTSTCAWQHKREATGMILKEIGQTRVLQLNEFELVQ